MEKSITLEYVILYLIAVLPGIIDIKIGWTGAAGVDKPLKVQIEVDGVNIGDFQAIGYY
jgi:hypothetical protein